MPIHEFQCDRCDARFEELIRRPGDASRLACPECGADKVQRQFSVFAARSAEGAAKTNASPPMGGCGRCGDPAGPCAMGG
ncbi:MAG: zinc ribbon domain-containing protein [Phycisphaerales bacterium]|nr:zinc ribbon domain-containing protein [Phycisphaerales bacterium]